MAEEKTYLDLTEENGTIRVSFNALGEIAAEAAMAVEGVASLCSLPQSVVKGVAVKMNEIGICTVDVQLLAKSGHALSQVARSVQTAVKSALDAAVDVEIAAVNVYVAGVALK